MPLIEPGKKAPAFTLKDQHGKSHRLSDYEGRPVVLYFYPKDDTPGCTKEACDFRDNLPKFKTDKAVVLGVSILDESSKAKFAQKYDLNFPLLADPDHEAAHPVMTQSAQLRARDFVIADAVGNEPHRRIEARDHILLHAHFVQAKAVDHVLGRQVHEHRAINGKRQLVDRRDVVLRIRI